MKVKDFSLLACQWGYPPASHLELIEVAKHADELGFHSFGLPHVPIFGKNQDSKMLLGIGGEFAYQLDPHALVPVLLHETKRMRVGFNILLTPLIHPFHWAKLIASLDVMSGGRALAGFGLGVSRPENDPPNTVAALDKLGTSTRVRGKTADESLEVMNRLWSDREPITFEGKFWTLNDVAIAPQSARQPRPEVWWAGMSKQSIERAARHADVLEITWQPEKTIREFIAPSLKEANEKYGGRAKLADLVIVEVLDYNPTEAEIQRKYWSPDYNGEDVNIAGTPERCAEQIIRLRDAGVEHFCLDLHAHGIDPITRMHEQMERWANEVVPLLK